MKRKYRCRWLFVALLSLVSCAVSDMVVEVIDITPANNSYVENSIRVSVKFNQKMDTGSCEEAFSLLSGGKDVEGKYIWNDSFDEMIFVPENELQNGCCYDIKILDSCMSSDGKKLESRAISKFYVGSEFEYPQIEEVFPNYNDVFPLNGVVQVSLNKPVDEESFERAFSISPFLPGYFVWNADSTIVEYHIYDKYNLSAVYLLAISSDYSDQNGVFARDSFERYFIAGEDMVSPEIVSISATESNDPSVNFLNFENYTEFHGININTNLSVIFSEAVDKTSFADTFIIIPSVEYSVFWPNPQACQILFHEELTPGEKYEIRFEKGFKDLEGNTTPQSFCHYMVTDGLNSEQLDVVSAKIINDNSTAVFFTGNGYHVINRELGDDSFVITIVFNKIIDKSTFPGSVSIEYLAGLNSGSAGGIKEFKWINDSTVEVYLKALDPLNYYRFRIKSGESYLSGADGIFLQEDKYYLFYIQE